MLVNTITANLIRHLVRDIAATVYWIQLIQIVWTPGDNVHPHQLPTIILSIYSALLIALNVPQDQI